VSAHKLKWENWMNGINFIAIKVQWSNVNSPNAHSEITIHKPISN
jgi:hypothetical protein